MPRPRRSPKKSKSRRKSRNKSKRSPKRRSRRKSRRSPKRKLRSKSKSKTRRSLRNKSKNKTRKRSKGIACVFDRNCASKFGSPKVKIAIEKGPKGLSLFAIKPIKKNNVIAYYKFKVNKSQGYTGKKNDMYAMSVYTRNDRLHPYVIGDVFEGSLEKPKHNVPYWGYFANEPSGNQTENARLDTNISGNYRSRTKVKPGDSMVYKIIATKNIQPGEEIVWCYGDSYGNRGYEANC